MQSNATKPNSVSCLGLFAQHLFAFLANVSLYCVSRDQPRSHVEDMLLSRNSSFRADINPQGSLVLAAEIQNVTLTVFGIDDQV